jgi:hypothetical protein
VTNLMLWGYILSVAPETASLAGGDRFGPPVADGG